MEILTNIGIIIVVILIFNLVIFVHELGHFLAAKWRGMVADRFQIWFGKPIWKKTIGGVQYGIGWIPAGGFVSLPQMATMEGIEGEVDGETKKGLKPAKPLDRIIVAFAGPLFSFGLAVICSLIVWGVGKPANKITTTTVGYVSENGTAYGVLKGGDQILEIEGRKVTHWAGGNALDSVLANIVLSEGDTVEFKVLRDGKELDLSTKFTIPETSFFDRKGMRSVGISPNNPNAKLTVLKTLDDSPARLAGLEKGDVITHANGVLLFGTSHFADYVSRGGKLDITVLRGGKNIDLTLNLAKPKKWDTYAAGVHWDVDKMGALAIDDTLEYPNPVDQVIEHAEMMWTTISKVVSPKTDINAGHMQSPIGIATNYFDYFKSADGMRKILWFTVLLNINLAILNMLPLPVLDGGHITTSLYEMIRRKAIPTKVMLVMQNAFVLFLMGFMLFVASKDVRVLVLRTITGEVAPDPRPPMEFAPPAKAEPVENEIP